MKFSNAGDFFGPNPDPKHWDRKYIYICIFKAPTVSHSSEPYIEFFQPQIRHDFLHIYVFANVPYYGLDTDLLLKLFIALRKLTSPQH